jgi:hypothetical protein
VPGPIRASSERPWQDRPRNAEDRWSDSDLVLQSHPAADEAALVEDWTHAVDGFGLADTLDVYSRGTRYRTAGGGSPSPSGPDDSPSLLGAPCC